MKSIFCSRSLFLPLLLFLNACSGPASLLNNDTNAVVEIESISSTKRCNLKFKIDSSGAVLDCKLSNLTALRLKNGDSDWCDVDMKKFQTSIKHYYPMIRTSDGESILISDIQCVK